MNGFFQWFPQEAETPFLTSAWQNRSLCCDIYIVQTCCATKKRIWTFCGWCTFIYMCNPSRLQCTINTILNDVYISTASTIVWSLVRLGLTWLSISCNSKLTNVLFLRTHSLHIILTGVFVGRRLLWRAVILNPQSLARRTNSWHWPWGCQSERYLFRVCSGRHPTTVNINICCRYICRSFRLQQLFVIIQSVAQRRGSVWKHLV